MKRLRDVPPYFPSPIKNGLFRARLVNVVWFFNRGLSPVDTRRRGGSGIRLIVIEKQPHKRTFRHDGVGDSVVGTGTQDWAVPILPMLNRRAVGAPVDPLALYDGICGGQTEVDPEMDVNVRNEPGTTGMLAISQAALVVAVSPKLVAASAAGMPARYGLAVADTDVVADEPMLVATADELISSVG